MAIRLGSGILTASSLLCFSSFLLGFAHLLDFGLCSRLFFPLHDRFRQLMHDDLDRSNAIVVARNGQIDVIWITVSIDQGNGRDT